MPSPVLPHGRQTSVFPPGLAVLHLVVPQMYFGSLQKEGCSWECTHCVTGAIPAVSLAGLQSMASGGMLVMGKASA